jgi:uncharacterized protein YbjT (DUF2867 family)
VRVAVAGAHGQIARRLTRLLAGRGDEVVGLVRNPDHSADLRDDGAQPHVVDLEQAGVDELASHLAGADAVVFAAGAGPGSGAARKDSLDRGGAVLLADACVRAGVRRYLLVSSMGTEAARAGGLDGVDDAFAAYLRAKAAAEDDLIGRDLAWTVLRPGALTDDPGTGRITLGRDVDRGAVPRDDVAAVLVALLDEPRTARQVLELVGGDVPVADAVAAAAAG